MVPRGAPLSRNMERANRRTTMAGNDYSASVRRDRILARIRHVFPGRDANQILTQLEAYGSEQHESDVERVYLAVLKLCDEQGAADPSAHVEKAKRDPRDVIAWAETPNQIAFGPTDDPAASEDLRKQDEEQYEAWLTKTS